jgi:LmbE family N-acetylglucosaminyl deacetylase
VNILAIGAHPDDIELGCGGLALKAVRNGHKFFMYTLTRGGASGDPTQRAEELLQSSKFIGANTLWIDNFEDTKLSNNYDLIDHIEYFIRKSHADIVFTHSLADTHHDHKAIAASTIEAGRFVPNIMAYEIPLTKDFKPQIFYDITDVITEKIELIRLFKSQHDKIYLKANAIKGLAEYRALQSRLNREIGHTTTSNYIEALNYVEAFEALKICVDGRFKLWDIPSQQMAEQWTKPKPNGILEYIITPALENSSILNS